MSSEDGLMGAERRESGRVKGIVVCKSLNKSVRAGRAESSPEHQEKAEQESVLRSGKKAPLDLELY